MAYATPATSAVELKISRTCCNIDLAGATWPLPIIADEPWPYLLGDEMPMLMTVLCGLCMASAETPGSREPLKAPARSQAI